MKKVSTLFTYIFILQCCVSAQVLKIKIIGLSDRKAILNVPFSLKQNDSIRYSATTNAAGEATINSVQPGNYVLSVNQSKSLISLR